MKQYAGREIRLRKARYVSTRSWKWYRGTRRGFLRFVLDDYLVQDWTMRDEWALIDRLGKKWRGFRVSGGVAH